MYPHLAWSELTGNVYIVQSKTKKVEVDIETIKNMNQFLRTRSRANKITLSVDAEDETVTIIDPLSIETELVSKTTIDQIIAYIA